MNPTPSFLESSVSVPSGSGGSRLHVGEGGGENLCTQGLKSERYRSPENKSPRRGFPSWETPARRALGALKIPQESCSRRNMRAPGSEDAFPAWQVGA